MGGGGGESPFSPLLPQTAANPIAKSCLSGRDSRDLMNWRGGAGNQPWALMGATGESREESRVNWKWGREVALLGGVGGGQ